MPPEALAALLGLAGTAIVAGAAYVGHILTARTTRHTTDATAEHKLIDQLQEELTRYRERTDARLDFLEAENRGYRAFIGIQRDHMAAHGIPLPDWPEGLPR